MPGADAAFLKVLGIVDENRICHFLVGQTGRVPWRAEGAFEESKGLDLRDALQKLMRSGSEGIGTATHSCGNCAGDRG
jgi:hypothetical protein